MTRHRAICTLAGALVIGASLVAARPGSAGAPKQSETMPREYVVKLDTLVGRDIASLAADYDLRVVKDVLASRGIYLLAARSSASSKQPAAKPVRDMLAKDVRVEWVELNEFIDASDDRFHAWPNGAPRSVGVDPGVWLHQAAVTQLRLDEVHQLSTGRGVIVAILDTGIDRKHPVFANQLVAGWDYVDDDQDPTDRKDFTDNDDDGVADEAFGHGTHVAGILSLVAPSVKILPARVLDADGRGNVFAVAEAIHDVVESGARVINLSFGTDTSTESHLLRDAIADTQHSNVIVVASAGNTGTTNRRFPAAFHKVVAVAGLARLRGHG